MLRLLLALGFVASALGGCASTPPLSEAAARQILASTPSDAGRIQYTTIGQWMPNTKGFDVERAAGEPQPKLPGVVVLTDKAILFQQWGGQTGLTVARSVPYRAIQKAEVATFGASARLIVQTGPDQFDSFAASEATGEVSIKAGTREMYAILSKYLTANR